MVMPSTNTSNVLICPIFSCIVWLKNVLKNKNLFSLKKTSIQLVTNYLLEIMSSSFFLFLLVRPGIRGYASQFSLNFSSLLWNFNWAPTKVPTPSQRTHSAVLSAPPCSSGAQLGAFDTGQGPSCARWIMGELSKDFPESLPSKPDSILKGPLSLELIINRSVHTAPAWIASIVDTALVAEQNNLYW